MKLKSQVTSLELSKELKSAGYKQEGLWWWYKHDDKIKIIHPAMVKYMECDNYITQICVAPTVAELGDALPENIESHKYNNKYNCIALEKEDNKLIYNLWADTEADARAKMWLYLKEGLL